MIASLAQPPVFTPLADAPSWTKDWPEWAQVLMDKPLRITLILVGTLLAAVIARGIVGHTTSRLAKKPPVTWPIPPREETAYLAARREARYRTFGAVAKSTISVTAWILAIALVLEAVGVNPGLIITSVGVAGVGVGFGAQNLIKDVIAGLFMLIEDQYGLGDVIDAGPATGKVVAMTLRITTLQDKDGVLWYVPNGQVTRIGNKTQADQGGGPEGTEPAGSGTEDAEEDAA
jgi:small conductance mechanosensitive channel